MTDSIPPTGGVQPNRRASDRRSGDRRASDRRENAGGKNLPALIGSKPAHEARPEPEAGAAEFNAQLLGQTGQKRGLKAGPPALVKARSAYLTAEWSGPHDRRKPAGRIARTQV